MPERRRNSSCSGVYCVPAADGEGEAVPRAGAADCCRAAAGGGLGVLPLRCRKASCSGLYCALLAAALPLTRAAGGGGEEDRRAAGGGGEDDRRAMGGGEAERRTAGAGEGLLPLRCRKASCSGLYCAPLAAAAAGEPPRAGCAGDGEELPPSLPERRRKSSCSGVYCVAPLALPLAWPLAWAAGCLTAEGPACGRAGDGASAQEGRRERMLQGADPPPNWHARGRQAATSIRHCLRRLRQEPPVVVRRVLPSRRAMHSRRSRPGNRGNPSAMQGTGSSKTAAHVRRLQLAF